MINTIRGNFSNKYRKDSLECPSCKNLANDNETVKKPSRDSQSHLLEECGAFSKERDQYDLNTNEGIIDFFKFVVQFRVENGQD